jgi:transcription initiation factor TFIIIB Brf1 subunit/transcription initiation factor TFIIB
MDCPSCKSSFSSSDVRTTERICTECGTVIDGPKFVNETFTAEPMPYHSGRSNAIYPGFVDGRGNPLAADKRAEMWRLRIEDVRSRTEKDGTTVNDFDIIVTARKIGVPDLVAHEAGRIHRRWRKAAPSQHGIQNSSCVVACVILACRLYRIPLDYKHAVTIAEADEEEVWRAIKRIKKQSGIVELQHLMADPIPIIGMAATVLHIPQRIRSRAIDLLDTVQDRGFKPSCMAGGLILRAYKESGETMPFEIEALAKVCWTTPGCLYKAIQKPSPDDDEIVIT